MHPNCKKGKTVCVTCRKLTDLIEIRTEFNRQLLCFAPLDQAIKSRVINSTANISTFVLFMLNFKVMYYLYKIYCNMEKKKDKLSIYVNTPKVKRI
jgi:uncharacterized protein with PQ loop repeat